jgi:hypothetical protein
MCASALTWEESIRFTDVRGSLANVLHLYVGIGGGLIDEAAKLPVCMTKTFSQPDVTGRQSFSITLSLPEGWSEAVQKACDVAELGMDDDIS